MHNVTFHNLGSADCVRIGLANGRKILFDYADTRDPSDTYDARCDLPAELRDDLGDREDYDIVAFTHLDRDHYVGSTDFFYFEHVKKYQDDVDGEPRIKMTVMWVPAAIITEKLGASADKEAKAIQKEARERFKAKKGIHVFSRPSALREWCEENDIDFDEREHLVTDAGQLAPGVTMKDDDAEFFAHSPFAARQDDGTVVDRNNAALVMHVTFQVDGVQTKMFLASDVDHEVLTDIVMVTEAKGNQERLESDINKVAHHCSHHSLSSKEREGDKSKPEPKVKRLHEHYGQEGCILVSSSDTIPDKGDDRDKEGANPPHRQAANYYKEDVVPNLDGEFKVTMEHPSKANPKPLVIEIDNKKATVRKKQAAGAAVAVAASAPRAG